MQQRTVKLQDLAGILGVSVSTVCRALRGDKGVAEATRAKALALAERMGYKQSTRSSPSQLPRPDADTRQIAVVVRSSELVKAYGEILVELLDYGRTWGFTVEVMVRPENEELGDSLQAATKAKAAAVVLLTWEHLQEADGHVIANHQLPVVVIGRYVEGLTYAVTHDDFAAGTQAARYLLALGHRRIAHIAGPQGSSAFRDRALGFQRVLQEHGCYDPALFIADEAFTVLKGIPHGVERLLAQPEPPTALWIAADTHAGAALMTLRAKGLRVPEDISVIGFDHIPEWAQLGLTTFDRRLKDIARHALQLVNLLLQGTVSAPVRVCVAPRLVEGVTTGVAPH